MFESPFGGLRGNVCTPSIARWKARGQFPYVTIELFRYLLQLRCHKRKSVEVTVFRRGWVTFSEYLTGKGASSNNQCWCQKTRLIAVSCGMKISAVHHLVLSQYTRLADRQTELQQQYRALQYMLHGKNEDILLLVTNVKACQKTVDDSTSQSCLCVLGFIATDT